MRTAYPGWDRSGGGSGSSPKGLMGGTPKGKYNWHTVVDGLSEYSIEPTKLPFCISASIHSTPLTPFLPGAGKPLRHNLGATVFGTEVA